MKNKHEQSDWFLLWDLVTWSEEKSNGGGREAAAEVKEATIATAVETPVIVVDGAVEVDEDITMNTAFDNEREATSVVSPDGQDGETSAPEDIILYKDPVLGVRDNSLSGKEEICDSVKLDILDQLDIDDEEETDDRIK